MEHQYSLAELETLELQMNSIDTIDLDKQFDYLKGHSEFSHIDDSNEDFRSYYFHNSKRPSEMLFIDIPKKGGEVYTDEGYCLGQQEWFDELFTFTKKFYSNL